MSCTLYEISFNSIHENLTLHSPFLTANTNVYHSFEAHISFLCRKFIFTMMNPNPTDKKTAMPYADKCNRHGSLYQFSRQQNRRLCLFHIKNVCRNRLHLLARRSHPFPAEVFALVILEVHQLVGVQTFLQRDAARSTDGSV